MRHAGGILKVAVSRRCGATNVDGTRNMPEDWGEKGGSQVPPSASVHLVGALRMRDLV